jgi:hypothetical protein
VVMEATVPVTLVSSVVLIAAVVVAMVATVIMGPPTLTLSSQLAALYFIVNLTSDQNNFMLGVQSKIC